MSKLFTIATGMLLVMAAACGDDGNSPKDAGHDAALHDAGIDAPAGPDASCFTNPDPNSNEQIINACTTAQKIYKPSNPPLLNPDGTLPPLPQ